MIYDRVEHDMDMRIHLFKKRRIQVHWHIDLSHNQYCILDKQKPLQSINIDTYIYLHILFVEYLGKHSYQSIRYSMAKVLLGQNSNINLSIDSYNT